MFGKVDDTVGNPHRAQIFQFQVFELILLLKLDKQLPVDRFKAAVSQSTVPSPLLNVALPGACHAEEDVVPGRDGRGGEDRQGSAENKPTKQNNQPIAQTQHSTNQTHNKYKTDKARRTKSKARVCKHHCMSMERERKDHFCMSVECERMDHFWVHRSIWRSRGCQLLRPSGGAAQAAPQGSRVPSVVRSPRPPWSHLAALSPVGSLLPCHDPIVYLLLVVVVVLLVLLLLLLLLPLPLPPSGERADRAPGPGGQRGRPLERLCPGLPPAGGPPFPQRELRGSQGMGVVSSSRFDCV